MKIEIDDDIFTQTASTPMLLAVFVLGSQGRHRVVVRAPGAQYSAWLAGRDAATQELCTRTIEWSLRVEASEPSYHAAHITNIPASRWSRATPQLTIADALDLMQRPYRLLVENYYADTAFVFAMMTPDERQDVLKRMDGEWLIPEHCGGITGIATRAKDLRRHPRKAMRCSALFDSDALAVGQPSTHAKRARTACGEAIHHYMLARRSIENHLPVASLVRWSEIASGKERRRRTRLVRAFQRLERSQQHHFNMKHGLEKDETAIPKGALFDALKHDSRLTLRTGFGDKISRLFERGVSEIELRQDGGWADLRPFVKGLIERIR